MLSRKKFAFPFSIVAVAALTLCFAAAPATAKKKKTTVIGQITHSNRGVSSTGAVVGSILSPALLTTKTVKNPKPGSITVNVTAVPDDPAAPNSIYVNGTVECKKKPKDPVTKYVVGGEFKQVPSPFTTKASFPFGVPKPAACRVGVAANMDPPNYMFGQPFPAATITITVLWKH